MHIELFFFSFFFFYRFLVNYTRESENGEFEIYINSKAYVSNYI